MSDEQGTCLLPLRCDGKHEPPRCVAPSCWMDHAHSDNSCTPAPDLAAEPSDEVMSKSRMKRLAIQRGGPDLAAEKEAGSVSDYEVPPVYRDVAERQLATLRKIGASPMVIAIAEKVVALAVDREAPPDAASGERGPDDRWPQCDNRTSDGGGHRCTKDKGHEEIHGCWHGLSWVGRAEAPPPEPSAASGMSALGGIDPGTPGLGSLGGAGVSEPFVEARELVEKLARAAVAPMEGCPLAFNVALEMAVPNVVTRLLPILAGRAREHPDVATAPEMGKLRAENAKLHAQVRGLTAQVEGFLGIQRGLEDVAPAEVPKCPKCGRDGMELQYVCERCGERREACDVDGDVCMLQSALEDAEAEVERLESELSQARRDFFRERERIEGLRWLIEKAGEFGWELRRRIDTRFLQELHGEILTALEMLTADPNAPERAADAQAITGNITCTEDPNAPERAPEER